MTGRNGKTTYGDAGVNIELGDDASKALYQAARATWDNRKGKLGEVVVPFDDFSGLRYIRVGGLPKDAVQNISFDGIGTKTEVAERLGHHHTAAFDLLAMVCDDAVVRGAEPVLVGSVLDVNTLGKDGHDYKKFVRQLAHGYVAAAKAANVAVVNGEVAELGARVSGYGPFNYNWSAGLVWFAREGRLFTGKEIREGDSLVGLGEEGFRSNGLSLVRRVFKDKYGEDWHLADFHGAPLGEVVLHPSRIYSAAVTEMFGGFDREPKLEVHGVSHITGGGLPGKLGRVLKPSGLGAKIDHPFHPSLAMLHCQELGNVPDDEAYKTWNMGQGMVVITPEPAKAIEVAQAHGIEAKIIGKVEPTGIIAIKNKGFHKKDGYVTFPLS
jgi:phosphoribosylformylglycinamidine cyclo-ligase